MMTPSPSEPLVENVAAVHFGAIGAAIKRGVKIDDASEHDYVLPQLLSAKVRVKDAERTLETAA